MQLRNSNIISATSILSIAIILHVVDGGPVVAGSAVSLCYTACNAGWCTCMTASGLVAGVAGPVGWYAWATGAAGGCSMAQAACMTACTAGGLAMAVAPTP